MPSLPEWLASQVKGVTLNSQPHPDGGHKSVWALPENLLPTEAQRQAIQVYIGGLKAFFVLTAENDDKANTETMVSLTKLLAALPAQRLSEDAAEAKCESFMVALEDVPYWAIQEAIRQWYRGGYGEAIDGIPLDYRWAPAPATLRKLAHKETGKLRLQIAPLHRVLDAVPLIDFSDQHCARMRDRMSAEIKAALAENDKVFAGLTKHRQNIEDHRKKASAETGAP
jgi:hypothetical protein